MNIRSLSEADVRCLARLHVQVWKDTYSRMMDPEFFTNLDIAEFEKNWEQELQTQTVGAYHLGAYSDDRLVGFISGGPARLYPQNFDCEIYSINILKNFHGKGLGKKLLSNITTEFLKHGFTSLYLWVTQENTKARRFYEGIGARYGENIVRYFSHYPDQEVRVIWDDLSQLIHQLNLPHSLRT